MGKLKDKLRKKQLSIGSWMSLGDTSIAEIMAKAGFDWLVIDMEHSAISTEQCQELIRIVDLCGSSPLVRIGENNPLLIKRAMDAGAHGIIVPMVNSRKDAENAVSALKYPPSGTRGVGLSRAQGYGASFNKYKKWLEEESIIIVQIMIGFFILELKKKTPPLSDKLNRGKIDIKWGLIHFWMAFLWFKRID